MKKNKFLFGIVISLFFSLTTWAQSKISGKVTEGASGQPLAGATITVKGTNRGTSTNTNGDYALEVSSGDAVLLFSFTGYETIERKVGNNTVLNVSFTATASALNEVTVTGSFDSRKSLEASIAISSINSKQLARITPVSAADILRNVPGVFVNSSMGEVRNSVFTRGISTRPNYNLNTSGLTYVSLQEDGLPISNIFVAYLSPDVFLRADATLNKLEAVRGGTASIIGANAPGGIFNYLSKTGGNQFAGEARVKFGLEGDGKNPYYRADLNFGGPLGKSGWSYNLGGFYRHAQGALYPGYPMNYGGQVKANLHKSYAGGSITFFAKYLNDHNGNFMNLIGRNFDKPELAPGVKNTDAYSLPAVALDVPLENGKVERFDSRRLSHAKEIAVGANWKHSFGEGFTIQNNARFSNKSLIINSTTGMNPVTLTGFVNNATAGLLGRGLITYSDLQSKQALAAVHARTPPPSWNVRTNNLPGQNILQNGIFYSAAQFGNPEVNEFMDQVVLTKKLGKMTFNVGAFGAISNIARYSNGAAGLGFSTLENRSKLLAISFYDSASGQTRQITNPDGFFKTGGALGFHDYESKKYNIAPFFGHAWQITDKLNLDWGVRFDHTTSKGTNYIRKSNNGADGGLDRNPLTIYDNQYFKDPESIPYEFSINTLSYSGALNYLLANNQSVYLRYSNGKKAPEAAYFQSIDSKERLALTQVVAEQIEQLEIGYKLKGRRFDLNVTPFYSKVSNIFTGFTSQDSVGRLYNLTPYFNSIETKGVELETTIDITKNFNVRTIATFQTSKFPQYKISTAGATTSKTDDTFLDYSGNKTDNNPNVIFGITPTYSSEKFYTFITWQYTGKRFANAPNAFYLPAYSQVDLGMGYDISKSFALSLNVNNLANTFGVMSWGAPGGFPAVFNLSDFSKAQREAQKNALFPIGGTQPRAFFMTLTYKFHK